MVFPINSTQSDKITLNEKGRKFSTLYTSWHGSDGVIGSGRAEPRILYIPLYHKIRIPFAAILDIIFLFNAKIEVLRLNGKIKLPDRLEWDIYLTSINSLKSGIFKSNSMTPENKFKCLLRKMPRFLWRVSAYSQNNPVFELLFDATDIEQGSLLTCGIIYDDNIAAVMKGIYDQLKGDADLSASPLLPILNCFSE